MRLLNARTMELEYFPDHRTRPKYAILSHTWSEDEVLYSSIISDLESCKNKKGFRKIKLTCEEAVRDGLQYAWVDTCCIDKTSSAELSEAINSMYQWYQSSEVCYAYLEDVWYQSAPTDRDRSTRPNGEDYPDDGTHKNETSTADSPRAANFSSAGPVAFKSSRWFSRGWTLQELIAPSQMKFFDRTWAHIGSKLTLAERLAKLTRIPEHVLRHPSLVTECSIAKRMSWASNRYTTRVEDEAYCLLGIFNVHMPLLYGEHQNAFIRLQKEIIQQSSDQTIFAWEWYTGYGRQAPANAPEYLAATTKDFTMSGNWCPLARSKGRDPFAINHQGLHISACIMYADNFIYGILDAFDSSHPKHRLAFRVTNVDKRRWQNGSVFRYSKTVAVDSNWTNGLKSRRITILNGIGLYLPRSIDLRIRCIVKHDWNSTAASVADKLNLEEISLDVLDHDPLGSLDPHRSIVTLRDIDEGLKENKLYHKRQGSVVLMLKISYQPNRRRILGDVADEIIVPLRLILSRGLVLAQFIPHAKNITDIVESDSQNFFRSPYSFVRQLQQTKSRMAHLHGNIAWNLQVFLIEPSINEPYNTLAVAIHSQKHRRTWKDTALLIYEGTKELLPEIKYVLTSAFGNKMAHHNQGMLKAEDRLIEYCLAGLPEDESPSQITLEQLYGGRKHWRRLRLADEFDNDRCD